MGFELVGELLADRDDLEKRLAVAEADSARWRSRCPVTTEDDTSAYTIELGHRLCESAGLSRIRETATYETRPNGYRVHLRHGAVRFINELSAATGRPALDILAALRTLVADP